MKIKNIILSSLLFVLLIIIIIISSYFIMNLRQGPVEESIKLDKIIITSNMKITEISKTNNIPVKVILNALKVDDNAKNKTILELNIDESKAENNIIKQYALYKETGTKNWSKIRLKFILWFIYLIIIFILIKTIKINKITRIIIYFISILLFGIFLGSDPSPMGTVKDAIVLFGEYKVIYKPRVIAFLIFSLIGVVIANKFICSWGCQFGALQDLIHRLFRTKMDKKGIIKQLKPPFWLTNSIRLSVLILIIIFAFTISFDLVGVIDPFKIFNPLKMGIVGIIFTGLILLLSIFIYRPFCHFICPFGFTGWLFEKISIFKIHVDYNKCIACEICVKSCPSNVMYAILKRNKKTIPDCFSCGTCITNCPENAISYKFGIRKKPEPGKFKKL